jgi:tetratricopeptide (TPR) repeat protein
MKLHHFIHSARVLTIYALLFALTGCAASDNRKVPITTSSNAAREAFLQGRDLQERLQGQESLQYFDKAIAQDPNFAIAYLYSALSQPSAKAFFEQLNKAVALIDKASEGERLWILGFQAGVNGNPAKQKEYYQKLVAAFPQDERAHNLLGNYYFGQQQWAQAIEEYKKSTAIAPNFSQPYNQLGYAHRSLENYAEAEKAFKKYIELIPNDPNPHDSYAELLQKMGRFEESIIHCRNALSHNPNFVASHIGIATDLYLLGKHQEARAQLQKLYEMARNDGERRAALFAMTVSYVDEGNMDNAMKEMEKQYALAEKINDAANMSGDLGTMGNILFESGKYDDAMALEEKNYDQAVAHFQQANQQNPYTFYRLAMAHEAKGDMAKAKAAYKKAADFNALNNLNYAFMRNKAKQKLAAMGASW